MFLHSSTSLPLPTSCFSGCYCVQSRNGTEVHNSVSICWMAKDFLNATNRELYFCASSWKQQLEICIQIGQVWYFYLKTSQAFEKSNPLKSSISSFPAHAIFFFEIQVTKSWTGSGNEAKSSPGSHSQSTSASVGITSRWSLLEYLLSALRRRIYITSAFHISNL